VALWVADKWQSSGGRNLIPLPMNPLLTLLYDATRLLEKERGLAQKLLGRARYFKYAAKALPEGVLAFDKSKRIAWFNQGAIVLLGLRRSHRKQVITTVLRLPEVLDLIEGRVSSPLEIPSPLNPQLTLELDIRPFMQGHDLMIVRDITVFKRNDAIRRDFVANASHELRTPLTVMQGYVEMMLDSPDSHADHWHKPLEQMHNQAERMRKIVEDMLILSSLENNDSRLEPIPVDVPALLTQIVEEARQLSGKKGHVITFLLETDKGLLGHEEYLRSAFTNLVGNAIRYTPDGGCITLRWFEQDQNLSLSVCDTGIGIASEHLPRIMERFYRVDSARSRETGGTGLGLAITRHVLERHHAMLSISSELGRGSCFVCCFPLQSE
jgi:two-component system phosphate regulon sensor histidine kinase PhoR